LTAGSTLVEDCRRDIGERHTITLGAKLNFAFALQRAGQPVEALPYARVAFEGYLQRFGADYPVALNSRLTLSRILWDLGHHTEAIEHAEQLVEGRTKVLGPSHPWTLRSEELLTQYRAARREL
jgi:hypothetical protein